MAFFLHHIDDRRSTVAFFAGATLRIGRGTNAELRLDDRAVELEHAVIHHDASGAVLRDRSRVSGVWMDDERLSERRLTAGDVFEIGGFQLTVRTLDPESPVYLVISPLGVVAPTAPDRRATFEMASDDLLALAEEEARARDVTGPTEILSADRSSGTFSITGPTLIRPRSEPTPDGQAAESEGDRPTRPSVPGPSPEATPEIDLVAAHRLRRGPFGPYGLSALVALGVLVAMLVVARGSRDLAQPGALSAAHTDTEQIGSCVDCHATPWSQVADRTCAGCHNDRDAPHQVSTEALAAAERSCLECHTEHRGGDALALVASGACVDCHGQLDRRLDSPIYAVRVTEFSATGHPEFSIAPEGADQRSLISENPLATDGGLPEFDHRQHLFDVPEHVGTLDCASCHPMGADGTIEEVSFESHCQGACHNLAFDPRFPGAEALHAAPDALLRDLIGRYGNRPQILDRLTPRERRQFEGRRLTREQTLVELARRVARRLVQDKCLDCHRLSAGRIGGRFDDLQIEPVAWRRVRFSHARFLHGPHLGPALGMACTDCHAQAPDSQRPEDVLLPARDACVDCHRPARDGETDLERLGGTTCVTCHDYHTSNERPRIRRASQEGTS